MTNYEVGDTVEALDSNGLVEDTGVVTKIEESYEVGVYKIWAMWKIDGEDLHFPSNHSRFRIKTKRSSDQEITLETVSKILAQYFDSYTVTSMYNPEQLQTVAKRVFDAMQAKQQEELQRQNDPEYQKYLLLKKKFETT